MPLRGSVCLYQGDELGLTEADMPFEDLQDPYGITVLARVQGPRRLPHADGVGSQAAARRLQRRPGRGALAAGAAPNTCLARRQRQQGPTPNSPLQLHAPPARLAQARHPALSPRATSDFVDPPEPVLTCHVRPTTRQREDAAVRLQHRSAGNQ